ncbi:MAG: YqgE/AlgH family protein [Gammaproteobacteria bacterium]|nr:YqgE/AlgH family protein [Gammaproteobacteria bacterium]NND53727.1 YqgE/AlgH family protein [Gammaproteobacteria bacterium]
MTETTQTFAGQLLVAMPHMADPNFDHSVTYICEHSEHGALGITINRPLDIDLGEVLDQLSLDSEAYELMSQPVLRGGPVQVERGFVIHETDHDWEGTTEVGQSIFVTTSQDILSDVARGKGPDRLLMALGYAGWGAGQLEEEIRQNAWLTVPASRELVFETPVEQRWRAAAASIGIEPSSLILQPGSA